MSAGGKILSENSPTLTATMENTHEKQISFALTVNAEKLLNNTKYRCIIHFSLSHKPVATKADNIPHYNNTWTSNVVLITEENDISGERRESSDKL